jgi:hypothetical protein
VKVDNSGEKKNLFGRIRSLLFGQSHYEEVDLEEPIILSEKRVRVHARYLPLKIDLAKVKKEYYIYPEVILDDSEKAGYSAYILSENSNRQSAFEGFQRLARKGDRLILGKYDEEQKLIFDYPDSMDLRRLSITHDGDALIFRTLVSDAEIHLTSLSGEPLMEKMMALRHQQLKIIRRVYGGAIEPLPGEEALSTLQAVNEVLEKESYRPLDERGKPGGIVELPRELTPIIIGDLHAQVDNLLTLLSHNGFMQALEDGMAALVMLGDAVHSEVDGQLEEMDSSLQITDLILRLKLRYPAQVFYIRGNHDSFSSDIFKAGVAQSLMWERAVKNRGGDDYLNAMNQFYDSLPYLIISSDFVACHAAPIKTRFNRNMLINIYKYPQLVRELTRNRLRRRNFPAGYARGDVKHFLNTLNLSQGAQFLVSHSPLNREDPLWREAGGIENHHIVFSANIPWVGVFTRVHGRLVPLSYRRENLRPLIADTA